MATPALGSDISNTGVILFHPPAPYSAAATRANAQGAVDNALVEPVMIVAPHLTQAWHEQRVSSGTHFLQCGRVETNTVGSKTAACTDTCSLRGVSSALPCYSASGRSWVLTLKYSCSHNMKVLGKYKQTHSHEWGSLDPVRSVKRFGLVLPFVCASDDRHDILYERGLVELLYRAYCSSSLSARQLVAHINAAYEATTLAKVASTLSCLYTPIPSVGQPLITTFIAPVTPALTLPRYAAPSLPSDQTILALLKKVANDIRPFQDAFSTHVCAGTRTLHGDHVYSALRKCLIRGADSKGISFGKCCFTLFSDRGYCLGMVWVLTESFALLADLFEQLQINIRVLTPAPATGDAAPASSRISAIWVDKCCGYGGFKNTILTFLGDVHVKVDFYHLQRRLTSSVARTGEHAERQQAFKTEFIAAHWRTNQEGFRMIPSQPVLVEALKNVIEKYKVDLASDKWSSVNKAVQLHMTHANNNCISDPEDVPMSYVRRGVTVQARGTIGSNEAFHRQLKHASASHYAIAGAVVHSMSHLFVQFMHNYDCYYEWQRHARRLNVRNVDASKLAAFTMLPTLFAWMAAIEARNVPGRATNIFNAPPFDAFPFVEVLDVLRRHADQTNPVKVLPTTYEYVPSNAAEIQRADTVGLAALILGLQTDPELRALKPCVVAHGSSPALQGPIVKPVHREQQPQPQQQPPPPQQQQRPPPVVAAPLRIQGGLLLLDSDDDGPVPFAPVVAGGGANAGAARAAAAVENGSLIQILIHSVAAFPLKPIDAPAMVSEIAVTLLVSAIADDCARRYVSVSRAALADQDANKRFVAVLNQHRLPEPPDPNAASAVGVSDHALFTVLLQLWAGITNAPVVVVRQAVDAIVFLPRLICGATLSASIERYGDSLEMQPNAFTAILLRPDGSIARLTTFNAVGISVRRSGSREDGDRNDNSDKEGSDDETTLTFDLPNTELGMLASLHGPAGLAVVKAKARQKGGGATKFDWSTVGKSDEIKTALAAAVAESAKTAKRSKRPKTCW
jgi:hypothetical protein